MGKLFAVIRREYLERVRNKWFVIVTVFGPVFFAAIMILPAALSVRGIRNAKVDDLRIIDASGAGLGARVAERLTRPPRDSVAAKAFKAPAVIIDTVPVDGVASAEAALITQVQAKTLAGYLVVDTATLARGAARYAGRNASSIGENERVETALRSALLGYRMEVAGLDSAASESITALRVRLATERITDEGKSGSGIAGMIFGLVVAMLLYMSIILYGQAIMRGVLEEKTSRVAEVIVASVKPEVLLAGKVIGVGAVGLTQFAVWIASGIFFWGERTKLLGAMGANVGASAATAGSEAAVAFAFPTIEPITIVALVLFFLLGYTFYASLFAAVGSMVSTQEEANQAVQPVMMMLIFSVIFIQPVMTNPAGQMAQVMSLIPFSAPIIMPMRMTATPVPMSEVLLSIGGLALACFASIWVSARIYRVGLLMYGKRPTMRELARWIRQS